jgi:hypothetical protein
MFAIKYCTFKPANLLQSIYIVHVLRPSCVPERVGVNKKFPIRNNEISMG